MALDFELIKTDDLTQLVLVDKSDWTGIVDAEAEILPPECETPEYVTINKNLVNTYTMSDLAVTEDRLPDGIYLITIRGMNGTETKTKKHLRTAYLRLLRDRLFLFHLEEDRLAELLMKDLAIIDLNIDAAYAYLKDGDESRAKYFYNRAKERIELLLECN